MRACRPGPWPGSLVGPARSALKSCSRDRPLAETVLVRVRYSRPGQACQAGQGGVPTRRYPTLRNHDVPPQVPHNTDSSDALCILYGTDEIIRLHALWYVRTRDGPSFQRHARRDKLENGNSRSRHPFDRPSTTPSKVRTRRHARQPESALLVCFGNTFLKYTLAATTCGCPEWGPGALGRVTLRRRRGGGGAAASKGGSQARRRLSGAISRLPATRTRSLRGGREIAG